MKLTTWVKELCEYSASCQGCLRLGADSGSDHELFTAKLRFKLKKIGKTTMPFRCNLNQIPYDYTVRVTNRFKELDLIECLKNYGWRFIVHDIVHQVVIKTIPKINNCKKAKWLSEEALQIAEK